MTTTAVPPTSTQLCGVFADIDAAVAAAHKAFLAFSDCSLAQRRIFINAVREVASQPVSYTHLTLPTIYSV